MTRPVSPGRADLRRQGTKQARWETDSRLIQAALGHAVAVGMKDGADDGVTVLVVDDEPQIVWVLRFSLEAEGYRTVSAPDGVRALEEIAEHRPRLVLLDLMMPNMDGWHVLEEMTKLPAAQRPRIVVVSALTSLQERTKVTQLGADAFVAKPFDVDELLGVVNGLELVG